MSAFTNKNRFQTDSTFYYILFHPFELNNVIAEDFFLLLKRQFLREQPYSSQILKDPRIQHTGAQFFFELCATK